MKRLALVFLFAVGCAGPSSSNKNAGQTEARARPLDPEPVAQHPGVAAAAGQHGAANAINALGVALYKASAVGNTNDVALSPLSISLAMSMTWAGAAGDTSAEMFEALQFANIEEGASDRVKVDDAMSKIQGRLVEINKSDGVKLEVANRLYGQKGEGFQAAFLERVKASYGAEVARVDFKTRPETVRKEINAWVSERTAAMIPKLLPPKVIKSLTRLVLVNAVYLKADWLSQFDKKATKAAPFYGLERESTAQLMYQTGTYAAAEVPGATVLELPYRGGEISMVFVLPTQRGNLPALEAALSGGSIGHFTKSLAPAEVEMWIPRFKVDVQGLNLVSVFRELGMKTAFRAELADFSPMIGKRGLSIGAIIHACVVDVNEVGTEAAAATAVVMDTDDAQDAGRSVRFRADHPFLYFIRDRASGAVLFIGRVLKP